MTTAQTQTFLTIPYEEREEAKKTAGKLPSGENALGFDAEKKLWFAKPGADLSKLQKWMPKQVSEEIETVSATEEFKDALTEAGFLLDGEPIMDGNKHRVQVIGDKKNQKSGVYVGYLDGRPAGWFENHRDDAGVVRWVSTGQRNRNANNLHARALAEQRRHTRLIQQQRTYAHHARRVNLAIQLMQPANQENGYLARKQVIAVEGVKVDKKGRLVIPLHDENDTIHSMQRISNNGFKSLKKGAQKSGNFFRLGEPTKDGEPILYAEGYATAASIHQATKRTVYMTVDAGNMPNVAIKLAEKYPNSPHVFLADNDQTKKVNKGLEKAQEAAELTNGKVIIPQFTTEEAEAGNTDFNDMHVLHGLEEVSKQLSEIELMQPTITAKIDEAIDAALATDSEPQTEEKAELESTQPEQPAIINEQETQETDETSTINEAPKTTKKQAQEKESDNEDSLNSVNIGTNTPINKAIQTVIPTSVAKKYIELDGKFYFERNPDTLAFIDRGTKIQTKLKSKVVATSMVDIAEARGWTKINVRGEIDFKRQVWLEATARGLTVEGYKPKEVDFAALKKLTKQKTVNEISTDLAKSHSVATENEQEKVNPMSGKLVEHGAAPYQHDKKNTESYFITLENSDGKKRTIWGKELRKAIEESKVETGQKIELEHLGRVKVTLKTPVREKNGKVVQKEIQAYRNEWTIHAAALRDKEKPLAELAKEHPDLINEIAAIKIAEKFSSRLPENQRDKFIDNVRERTAETVGKGERLPTIKIRERVLVQEKENHHDTELER